MIDCRYVGGIASEIGDREFDTVGQLASLSEQGFKEAVNGGAAFILSEDFDRCNFLPEDLDKYGNSGQRIDPSSTFSNSLALAQSIYRSTKQRLSAGEVITGSDQLEQVVN